ncbi:tetraspanin tsp3 [Diplodia corticola]|uniref:Tetraspanin tsp3 n=1 Tax=Diplodia corticola TaxID=236234 RepID=A0A1J9RH11_9PEZI|nr:tetraspanin tsp3 [Diplodia corticola]OJD31835.1 tetraspanin tsp3 [Diplodia corticola]
MAYSKRSVVTVLSVMYFVALTVVACYAHYCKQRLSLPVPSILSGLTVILPALHGVCLERLTQLARPGLQSASASASASASPMVGPRNKRHDIVTTLTLLALTIFTTVLATMAGTHLAPADGLSCALDDKWLKLFRNEQGPEIRRIQDTFNCCGLRSVYDMAWPFEKHEAGNTIPSTCPRTYGRDRSCFGAWRGEEQVVSGLIIVVCGGVWLWDMIILYVPGRRPSWLARGADGTKLDNHVDTNGHAQRTTEYLDTEDGSSGYYDAPVDRVVDANADPEAELEHSLRSRTGSVQRAIEARLGIDGEHDEHHTLVPSSQSHREENEWARS